MNQYKSSCLLDATIVFLEQRGNRINLLVQFTKHQQVMIWNYFSYIIIVVHVVESAQATWSNKNLTHRRTSAWHVEEPEQNMWDVGPIKIRDVEETCQAMLPN